MQLKRNKIKQIARILTSPKKNNLLQKRLEKRGDLPRRNVMLLTISGKRRVIKVGKREMLTHAANIIILRQHALAVRSGALKPKHYSLEKTAYDYVGKEFSVAHVHAGVGLNTLLHYFDYQSHHALHEEMYRYIQHGIEGKKVLSAKLRSAEQFLAKHPQIRLSDVLAAHAELARNLEKLDSTHKIISFDMTGFDNVIVKGYDSAHKRFRFALIDQIYLGNETLAAQKLNNYIKSKKTQKQ